MKKWRREETEQREQLPREATRRFPSPMPESLCLYPYCGPISAITKFKPIAEAHCNNIYTLCLFNQDISFTYFDSATSKLNAINIFPIAT
jgi:hypothetical protein